MIKHSFHNHMYGERTMLRGEGVGCGLESL